VIVDDILDTGATLLSCCRWPAARGVERPAVAVTHGVLTGADRQQLRAFGVRRIRMTDSVAGGAARTGRAEVLSVAPVLTPVLTGRPGPDIPRERAAAQRDRTREGRTMATRTGIEIFRDRHEAGRVLAESVRDLRLEAPVVIGLPRGGVPVAYEVALALDAPLDVLVARKIGAPGNPELAIGAVAEGGARVLDEEMIRRLMVSHEELERSIARATDELQARLGRYRLGGERIPLAGRTVVVVDDGLATGATARAALQAVRAQRPRRVVLAVPVGSPDTVASLDDETLSVVCVLQPERLWAIGYWYRDFGQTSDAEVAELLSRARRGAATVGGLAADPPPIRTVAIALSGSRDALAGDLVVPDPAAGLVIFAHGSGSSRHSSRNRHVAATLNRGGFATLLLDLLTRAEEVDRRNVFDVPMLAARLLAATAWAAREPALAALPVGYFGASTGAGAALWAAAEAGGRVRTVVSRGGRPDLASARLGDVRASVLLIVGGRDELVLELNRRALERLRCPAELTVVPGATHLFEEPGALDEVARLATEWFAGHLSAATPTA
jgi:putative phosphoribosyl transferase